jgi:hypothetical protein
MRMAASRAGPAGKANRWLRAVLVSTVVSAFTGFLAITCGGCSRRDKRPTPPASPLALGWISPMAGDSVAGLVDLEVEVRGDAVRSVVFLASGLPVDTATAAPWTGQWRGPNFDTTVRVVLQAVVQRADGSGIVGGEIAVWVVPNRPPHLTLLWPRPTTWIERTGANRIKAVAVDPEEGPVPAGRVRWSGLALGRQVIGAVLPLEILREEEQRIVVEAADRWNECARETLVIRPFRYAIAESPSVCAENAAAAIRAMDPAGLAASLADSFLFVPCAGEAASAEWALVWSRPQFLEMAGVWLMAPSTAQVEFHWAPMRSDAWGTERDERAWMEYAETSIRFRDDRAPPGAAVPAAGIEVTAVAGSTMQLSLRRAAGQPWRITSWRELATGEGRSLAGLLASRSGLPAPRLGAGCLVRQQPLENR